MMSYINKTIEKLNAIIARVTKTVDLASNSANQINITADNIFSSAQKQEDNLHDALQTVKDIADDVSVNIKTVEQTSAIFDTLVLEAMAGGESVKDTENSMQEVQSKIQEIEKIAVAKGLLFSSRLQVERWGNQRGK